MKVLVIGANGFVGRAVCAALRRTRHAVTPAVRCDYRPSDSMVMVIA